MQRSEIVVATTHAHEGNPLPGLLVDRLEAEGFEVWRHALAEVERDARRDHRTVVVVLHWVGHLTRHSTRRSTVLIAKLAGLLVSLRWRAGGRVVWYLHNEQSHEVRHPVLERVVRRLFASWLADRIVVMSPEGLVPLTRRQRRRARSVPQPTYETSYAPAPSRDAARAALGIAGDATVFLAFGRIRPYKGIPDLLDAFRDLADPSAVLLVRGACDDVALATDVEARARADTRVDLQIGEVDDRDIPRLLAAADWVVLPYRRVLNSAVAMLAMTFETPVVAPLIGALPTVLTDGGEAAGVLYEPGPGRLLAALSTACETTPTARAAMLDAAGRIRARSSVEEVGRRLADVIDEVAAQRPKWTLLRSATRRNTATKSS